LPHRDFKPLIKDTLPNLDNVRNFFGVWYFNSLGIWIPMQYSVELYELKLSVITGYNLNSRVLFINSVSERF